MIQVYLCVSLQVLFVRHVFLVGDYVIVVLHSVRLATTTAFVGSNMRCVAQPWLQLLQQLIT